MKAASGGHIEASSFEQFWKFTWWIFVKGWHATEFALLAWLCCRAYAHRQALHAPNARLGRTSWWVGNAWWVFPGLYAVADEFHQLFVRYRGGRLSDVFIDWLGIVAFAALSGRIRLSKPGLVLCGIAWILLLATLSYFPFGMPQLVHKASQFAP